MAPPPVADDSVADDSAPRAVQAPVQGIVPAESSHPNRQPCQRAQKDGGGEKKSPAIHRGACTLLARPFLALVPRAILATGPIIAVPTGSSNKLARFFSGRFSAVGLLAKFVRMHGSSNHSVRGSWPPARRPQIAPPQENSRCKPNPGQSIFVSLWPTFKAVI